MAASGVDALSVRIIGPGRAGRSFARAFERSGVDVDLLGRNADVSAAAADVDAVLICTPDLVIRSTAETIAAAEAVVLHCSGASRLDVLESHERRGSIHPLMALPDPDTGAARLLASGWFAVAGDPIAARLVERLSGRHFEVDDEHRSLYHATAAISANHLVALFGQVERLAERSGVPVEAFLDLAQGSFDDVRRAGALRALTGPASRGDTATLDAHRHALPDDEVVLYDALAQAAATLAARRNPPASAG